MATEFEAGRWWRIIAPDGSVRAETSDEDDARERMRAGDQLQRLWTCQLSEWRPAPL